jgi:hypothetical protein
MTRSLEDRICFARIFCVLTDIDENPIGDIVQDSSGRIYFNNFITGGRSEIQRDSDEYRGLSRDGYLSNPHPMN